MLCKREGTWWGPSSRAITLVSMSRAPLVAPEQWQERKDGTTETAETWLTPELQHENLGVVHLQSQSRPFPFQYKRINNWTDN